MENFLSAEHIAALTALLQILMIDLSLAGDNAIVIGLAAAGLPPEKRKRAIAVGILGATALRILFALITVELLSIPGLVLAGGLMLLYVSWKMWVHIRQADTAPPHATEAAPASTKTLRQAIIQIIIADVSMSLDNVLAVAGAAREHVWVLVTGLLVSVILMGLAATAVEKLMRRYAWIAKVGLAIIVFVALQMMWDGGHQVWTLLHEPAPSAP